MNSAGLALPKTDDPAAVRAWVQRYYGEVLTQSQDLKTNACCATGEPAAWLKELIANVHDDVQDPLAPDPRPPSVLRILGGVGLHHRPWRPR